MNRDFTITITDYRSPSGGSTSPNENWKEWVRQIDTEISFTVFCPMRCTGLALPMKHSGLV